MESADPPVADDSQSEGSDTEFNARNGSISATDPIDHLSKALARTDPLNIQRTKLNPRQEDLLRWMATSPETLMAATTEALDYWRTRKEALRSAREQYVANLPDERKGTLGKLDLFILAEMLQQIDHTDHDFVSDLAKGFPITGDLPSGGLGTPIDGGQRVHGRPA